MRDIPLALVAYLKSVAAVQALVGDAVAGYRVYGGEIPQSESPNMPRHVIVVRAAPGGAERRNANLQEADFEVVSFGEWPQDAEALRLETRTAMEAVARTVQDGTLLHSAIAAPGVTVGRDRDGKWPFVSETWRVLASEVEVA